MEEVPKIASMTELMRNPRELIEGLHTGPVVITKDSQASAVLVGLEEWNKAAQRSKERRFTEREVEAILKAREIQLRGEPALTLEEHKARMQEKHVNVANPVQA